MCLVLIGTLLVIFVLNLIATLLGADGEKLIHVRNSASTWIILGLFVLWATALISSMLLGGSFLSIS